MKQFVMLVGKAYFEIPENENLSKLAICAIHLGFLIWESNQFGSKKVLKI